MPYTLIISHNNLFGSIEEGKQNEGQKKVRMTRVAVVTDRVHRR